MVDRDLVLKGEPRTNAELFELLCRAGWLGPELTRAMRNLAGFRNIVVHGYADVSLDVVRDAVRNHLPDLIDFTATIGARFGRQ